ncbi:MAG: hypothetical protein P8P20_02560 [Acidimicrobiales bacterium]|nr:hypothetical protein [Acidimicrobiales bacterium]
MARRQRGMEKTTTAAALATTLPEFDTTCDVEFARRSVRYMLNNWCDANEIVDTLTIDLGVSSDVAQTLLSETTTLVAA